MTFPHNGPYHRRFTDPARWPSGMPNGAADAVRITQHRVNELAWEIEADNLAREIQQVIRSGGLRRGDPGE